jgi:hypothetical protein
MIRNVLIAAVLGAAVWAQAPVLNGKFVLAEEGGTAANLGVLVFDAKGTVAGTQYQQAPGVMAATEVTGTYAINADGSGSMTLYTQVATEDGTAPGVVAVYEFLNARASGFVAIRRDNAGAAVAAIQPASAAASFTGTFVLADAGKSPSGEAVAEIGVLAMRADGSVSGKIVLKQNSTSSVKTVEGSYAADGSGFGRLRLTTPSTDGEDGAVVLQTTSYVYVATAKQELIALRSDNSLLGLARLEPVQ